jgi:phosphatidylserine/phosphatidylglycerophosphate/cardiolipin synthase-like enzyme
LHLSSARHKPPGVRTAQAAEPEIHYAPVENLEHIDIELIRSATKSVDMAAFTLTDWAIIAALKEAHTRGVADCLVRSERMKIERLAHQLLRRGRLDAAEIAELL